MSLEAISLQAGRIAPREAEFRVAKAMAVAATVYGSGSYAWDLKVREGVLWRRWHRAIDRLSRLIREDSASRRVKTPTN